MKLKTFSMILDAYAGVYQCGQRVTGKVILEIEKELKVKDIRINLTGLASVCWTEQQGDNSVTYSAGETYINETTSVTGRDQSEVKISAGRHEYLFSFQLPESCPSSFESDIGSVRYELKSTIDRPWRFDQHTRLVFTVSNNIDLNMLGPEVARSKEVEDMKQLCCFCCASDPIIGKIWVERVGYVAGETINFRAEVENKSSRKMKGCKVRLIMSTFYYAAGKTNYARNILQKVKLGKVKKGKHGSWNGKLSIPPVPPSGLVGCSIIDIKYYVLMTVDPAGPALDLDLYNEVIIGTIPLTSVVQQYGVQPLPTSLPPPSPASSNLYAGNLVSTNNPQVFYAESALGQRSVTGINEDHTTGDQQFAPLYGYYKWDNTDPTSHFTTSGV